MRLAYELGRAGISFQLQQAWPVKHRGISLDCGYRVDVLLEDSLILELKRVDASLGIHEAQWLTYLKLAGIKTGLLINFNVRVHLMEPCCYGNVSVVTSRRA